MFIPGSAGVIIFHHLILLQSPFLFYLQLHAQSSIATQHALEMCFWLPGLGPDPISPP